MPLAAQTARGLYAMNQDRHLYSRNHIKGCWEYHVQWCTKYRFCALRKQSIKADCEVALQEAAKQKGWELLELAVMPDHVHAVVRVHDMQNPSNVLFYLKGRSAYEVFKKHPNLRKRYWGGHLWSQGSFVRTVGADLEVARNYVRNQADIHQTKLSVFTENSPL